MLTRRKFLTHTGTLAAALLLPTLKHDPPIETFVDHRKWHQYLAGPKTGEWFQAGDNSEYFFANTPEQSKALALAAWDIPGSTIFFSHGCEDLGTWVPHIAIVIPAKHRSRPELAPIRANAVQI